MPFTEPEHCVLRPQFNKPEPQVALLGPNHREQRDKEEVASDLERAGSGTETCQALAAGCREVPPPLHLSGGMTTAPPSGGFCDGRAAALCRHGREGGCSHGSSPSSLPVRSPQAREPHECPPVMPATQPLTCCVSCVRAQPPVTSAPLQPLDCSRQAPLSMRSPAKIAGGGCHFLLHHSGIEPTSPALQVDSLPWSHQGSPFSQWVTENYEEIIVVEAFIPSHKWWTGLAFQEESCNSVRFFSFK